MELVALSFFPFPYVLNGERHDGLRYPWSPRCSSCDRQCERTTTKGPQLCSYGINYERIDKDLLLAGIVVRDAAQHSPARSKMLRKYRNGPTASEVGSAVERYRRIADKDLRELAAKKNLMIEEYRSSAGYRADLLLLLKPDLNKMLAQIHDYRQFVSQVVQNINVVLESRAPGAGLDRQLALAAHEEAAIYHAARLMEEKILSALFLLDPDRITDPDAVRVFRLHGCVLKYVRVYQRAFDQKHIRVTVAAETYASIRANPAAVSVIPHTLIDNALKYAPRESRVEIDFAESVERVVLSVSCFGPEIHADERDAIFDLFTRGREARRAEPDGTGFGLYLAQLIASKLGTRIEVRQQPERQSGGLQWTTFSVALPVA